VTMRVLVCPDTFKGTLSSRQAAEAIAEGITSARPGAEILLHPMADGGHGTLETLSSKAIGRVDLKVLDPLRREIEATYLLFPDSAYVEMAQASGLVLLREHERDVMKASSYGTGQLILDAAKKRDTIIVGLGGSATNDGGIGMMQALGVRFLDKEGRELEVLADMARLYSIDTSRLRAGPKIVIASDVTNPLTGQEGASAVYGPQKGATAEQIRILDNILRRYAAVLRKDLGKDVENAPGAGSAGGMGASLLAFFDAEMSSGAEMVMEMTGFEEALNQAALVVTGEGRIDSQTASGKTISMILQRAKKQGRKVIASGGCLGEGWEKRGGGVCDSSYGKKPDMEYLSKNAYSVLREAAKEAINHLD